MSTSRPNITEVLEREKEYYAEQIRRINIALAALNGELPKEDSNIPQHKTTKSIQWTSEIKKIFDSGVELNMRQLRNKLAEKGFVEALDKKGKNSIYSTVSRLLSEGIEYLEKTKDGYRKKQVTVKGFFDSQENQGAEQ